MEEKDRQSLKELWALFLDDGLNQIIFSSPVNSSGLTKARVRPLYLKGSLVFQLEEFTERQAFHKNLSRAYHLSIDYLVFHNFPRTSPNIIHSSNP